MHRATKNGAKSTGKTKAMRPKLEKVESSKSSQQTEEALRKEHEFSRSIIETAQAVILILDTEGKIISFNPYMEQLCGYKLEEVKGEDWFETFLPKQDWQRIRKVFKSSIDNIQTCGNVNPIVTKDGREIDIEWYDKTLKGDDGKVIGLLSIGRDITERRKAEEENIRLLKAVETAKEAINITSLDLVITYTNDAVDKLFGYEKGELIGKHVSILNADSAAKATAKKIADAVAKQGYWEGEIANKRKDGTEFIGHATISATKDENGKITGHISVQHDITGQRQAEAALKQQHNLLRTLIDSIPDSIYVKDTEGRFLVANNEMARRIGAKTPDELIGKTNYDFYPKTEADKYYADDQKLIRSGRPVINRENSTLIPATGEQICNLKTKMPLKDASGKVVSIVGIGRDVTERKQVEKALRKAYDELEKRVEERTAELAQANEQLRRDIVERQQLEQRVQQHQMEVAHYSRLSTVGEMTSGLAHEINQPLCAIVSYARGALQMMKSGTYDSDELLDVMKEIGTQAERSGKIIRRLEKLVRKREVRCSSIDINDVINEAIGFMEAEARYNKVTIQQIAPSGKIPMILGDSIQIEQVLLNILSNSFEAMYDTNNGERHATIEVLTDNGSMVQVSISDNGEGLAVEDVDEVFEAFFTTKSNGLGMGLAISRTIIEAHGGRIWAERNETGGATFRFILPVEGAKV